MNANLPGPPPVRCSCELPPEYDDALRHAYDVHAASWVAPEVLDGHTDPRLTGTVFLNPEATK